MFTFSENYRDWRTVLWASVASVCALANTAAQTQSTAEGIPESLPAEMQTATELSSRLFEQAGQSPGEQSSGGEIPAEDTDPRFQPPLDGLSTSERLQWAKQRVARIGWDRFQRNSAVAPVSINIDALEDAAGTRIGYEITSLFVAYAPLDSLRNRELLTQMLGEQNGSAEQPDDESESLGREVPPAVLESRGIAPNAERHESYGFVTLPLMNRVEVRGVVRVQTFDQPNQLKIVWEFDPRFTLPEGTPGEFQNTWTKLEPNEVGRIQPGPAQPYAGCAGYTAVYELDPQQNQLLIETRMVLHEPQEWFSGSNFLRSKLPLTLQESARDFRRKLNR